MDGRIWQQLAAYIAVAVALALTGAVGCAEEPPPPTGVEAAPIQPPPAGAQKTGATLELFADDRDPAIAAWVETQLAAWKKAFPTALTVRVLNPDDKANYARLTALETAAGLKTFAAVEAFVYRSAMAAPGGETAVADETWPAAAGLHPIALVGQAEIAARGSAALRALIAPQKGPVTDDAVVIAAAKKLLADCAIQAPLPPEFPKVKGKLLDPPMNWGGSWALKSEPPAPQLTLTRLYLPIDCPVCTDTDLLVLQIGDRIGGVAMIRPIERYGEPIPAEAAKFLEQFQQQPLDGGLDQRLTHVDGIAGATKTVNNVKKLLGDFYRDLQPPKPTP